MARVLRLVPKAGRKAGEAYAALLVGLLVILSGCLVLTILISLLGV